MKIVRSYEEFLTDLSVIKIGAKSVSKILEYFKDKRALNRFKGITDLWDLFQNSPTLENQIKDLERIFNFEVNIKKWRKSQGRFQNNN